MDGIYFLNTNNEYDFLFEKYFSDIADACIKSEFQFLDKNEIRIDISENENFEFKDFYYICRAVPLFSEYVYNRIREIELSDSVFEKKILIYYSGVCEIYYMILPRRIRCIDYEKTSEISSDNNAGIIISDLTGRYDIFKIYGINDNNIYIKERLKIILEDVIDNITFQ